MKHTNDSVQQTSGVVNDPHDATPFQLGWRAYCDYVELTNVPVHWRRGWFAALDAHVRAEKEAAELADDIMDREDWARGGW